MMLTMGIGAGYMGCSLGVHSDRGEGYPKCLILDVYAYLMGAGRVRVDGEHITGLDAPAPAGTRVVIWTECVRVVPVAGTPPPRDALRAVATSGPSPRWPTASVGRTSGSGNSRH